MSKDRIYGWICFKPKKEMLKPTSENILAELLPPSGSELQRNGSALKRCIFREGKFIADFESKDKAEKFQLLLRPKERNHGEITKLVAKHIEKIVLLKEKENSDFSRYFEFETVYRGHVSVWQIGISTWDEIQVCEMDV